MIVTKSICFMKNFKTCFLGHQNWLLLKDVSKTISYLVPQFTVNDLIERPISCLNLHTYNKDVIDVNKVSRGGTSYFIFYKTSYHNAHWRFMTTLNYIKTPALVNEALFSVNWEKLMHAFHKGKKVLVQTFIENWNLNDEVNSQKWRNDRISRIKFTISLGRKFVQKLDDKERAKLHGTKMTDWSFTALCESLKCLNAEVQYEVFEKLENLQCQMNRVYKKRLYYISPALLCNYYKRISILLFEINVPFKEVDLYKPTFIKPVNFAKFESENLDPRLKRLKNLGEAAFRLGAFEDAIMFYTEALYKVAEMDTYPTLIPCQELYQLYFNRSQTHRALNDFESAEKDAERAEYFLNLNFTICQSFEDVEKEIPDKDWDKQFDEVE